MKFAIVGSRRRSSLYDRELVFSIVQHIKEMGGSVTSGACRIGADKFAREACDILGVEILEFPVEGEFENRWEFAKSAYARNEKIAEACDVCFALVADDRTGGTENTIDHCHRLGKKVFLVDSHGDVYLSVVDQNEKDSRKTGAS